MSRKDLTPRQSVDNDGDFPVATGDQGPAVEQARGPSDCPTRPATFDGECVHPYCSIECQQMDAIPGLALPTGGEDVCEGCVCETCGVEL